jgi:hypothetical protein
MGGQPQKTQRFQKFFFCTLFCRALFLDHFGKKSGRFPVEIFEI